MAEAEQESGPSERAQPGEAGAAKRPRSLGYRLFSCGVIGCGLTALVGFVGIGVYGATIPARHTVTRSVELPGTTPEAVYAVIADREGHAEWHADVKSVERLEDLDGQPVWREFFESGDSVVYVIKEALPPQRLVTDVTDQEKIFEGTWTYEVSALEGGGTQVSLTEEGHIPNAIMRALISLVSENDFFVERYLAQLAKKHGVEQVSFPDED